MIVFTSTRLSGRLQKTYAKVISHERMNHAVDILGGILINFFDSEGFHSEIPDDYEAIMSIIKRHPMNQFEVDVLGSPGAAINWP